MTDTSATSFVWLQCSQCCYRAAHIHMKLLDSASPHTNFFFLSLLHMQRRVIFVTQNFPFRESGHSTQAADHLDVAHSHFYFSKKEIGARAEHVHGQTVTAMWTTNSPSWTLGAAGPWHSPNEETACSRPKTKQLLYTLQNAFITSTKCNLLCWCQAMHNICEVRLGSTAPAHVWPCSHCQMQTDFLFSLRPHGRGPRIALNTWKKWLK